MKTVLGSLDSSPRRGDRHPAAAKAPPVRIALTDHNRSSGGKGPPASLVGGNPVGMIGLVTAAVIACGGTAKPDSTLDSARTVQNHDTRMGHMGEKGETGEMGHMGEHGERGHMNEMGEMAAMPPEVKKFHDTLAPRWHAEHGPQRMTDTCTAIPQFHADVEAILTSTPPNGAKAADWSANAKQLSDAVAALDATCKTSDAAAFEQAFTVVHNHFHGLLAAAGDSHEEHGKSEHAEPEHAEHHH